MDKITKYRRQSFSHLILFVLLAILSLGIFMRVWGAGDRLVVSLMGAACLMTYVHYVSLKTKVEFLEELRKEGMNKPNKES